jgi:hypothetical protein
VTELKKSYLVRDLALEFSAEFTSLTILVGVGNGDVFGLNKFPGSQRLGRQGLRLFFLQEQNGYVCLLHCDGARV